MPSFVQVLNQSGEVWWNYVFHATWTSSLVAAALLAVVFSQRRWPAQLRYGILIIALIKFAVPPMLALPVGLFSNFGPKVAENMVCSGLIGQPVISTVDNSFTSSLLSIWKELAWPACLMLVHLTGCALLVVRSFWHLLRVVRISNRAIRITRGRLYERFSRLSARLGLHRRVSLLVTLENAPPTAFGILRPRVMVSRSVVSDMRAQQMDVILAHELAHHRRLDLWVNAFQVVLGIWWWFNPLVGANCWFGRCL